MSKNVIYCEYKSPIGTLTVSVNEKGVTGVYFEGDTKWRSDTLAPSSASKLLHDTIAQLEEFFAGSRRVFDLPLAPQGTEFQMRVWQALKTIPYGETRSYRDIAEMCGCPKGYRAVGMANNRNPISIIIPCHRVIGADGSLVGYGGGLDKKMFLLALERDVSEK